MLEIITLIPCPVAIVVLALATRRTAMLARAASILMWAQFAIALGGWLPYIVGGREAIVSGPFRVDGIAAMFVILNTVVVAATLAHAVGFFRREAASEHNPSVRTVREFYLFAALFLLSMYAVVAADNLGLLWIAVEAT